MDYRERNLAPPQERECLGAGRRPRPGIMGKTPYGSEVPAAVLAGKAPAIEPTMQAVDTIGAISGAEIIDDLCEKLAAQLSRHDSLRASDSYCAYTAAVTVTLQGVDTSTVAAEAKAGSIDPARPSTRVQLSVEAQGSMQPDSSLERPVDPQGISQLAPRPRSYAVRGSSGKFVPAK